MSMSDIFNKKLEKNKPIKDNSSPENKWKVLLAVAQVMTKSLVTLSSPHLPSQSVEVGQSEPTIHLLTPLDEHLFHFSASLRTQVQEQVLRYAEEVNCLILPSYSAESHLEVIQVISTA